MHLFGIDNNTENTAQQTFLTKIFSLVSSLPPIGTSFLLLTPPPPTKPPHYDQGGKSDSYKLKINLEFGMTATTMTVNGQISDQKSSH